MADSADDLLGGYATSTLNAEERRRLYSAALEDQALFDALVEEDVLREAFDDPATRASVLTALNEAPSRSFVWSLLSLRAGAVAAVLVTAGLGVLVYRQNSVSESPADSIVASNPPPAEAPPTIAAPARFESWLPSATAAGADSVFRPADTTSATTKSVGVPPEQVFVADRAGRMAIFTVTGDGQVTRVSNWESIDAGATRSLPSLTAGEVRVIVVDLDVSIERDADAIAAVDSGRGVVYALRISN